jgi:hypothetical protein
MDFLGTFRLLVAIRARPELRSVLKIYDDTGSDKTSSIHPHHGFHGSLQAPRRHLDRAGAQVSLKIYDVTSSGMMHSDNTLTVDFMDAFRLLAAIRTRPELRSVSKYDVTSSDMTYSIHPHHGFQGRLQAPRHHPDQARAQVSLKI